MSAGTLLTIPGPSGEQATISVRGDSGSAATRAAASALRATVVEGVDSGISASGTAITIGRGRGGTGRLQIADPRASRDHVSLSIDAAGRVTVRDLGSQNGTTVTQGGRDRAIQGGEVEFPSGGGELVVRLGDSSVRVEIVLAARGGGGATVGAVVATGGGSSRNVTPLLLGGGGVFGIVALLFVAIATLGGPPEDAVPTSTPTAVTTATPVPTEAVASCQLEETSQMVIDATAQVIRPDGGSGTAFHLGDGMFVTAAHVVAGFTVVGLDSELMSEKADVLYMDEGADVAMLQSVETRDLPALEWAEGDIPVGRTVATVGYPAGAVTGEGSLSRGAVSKLRRLRGVGVIQTDVPINLGNSGGALIDECGSVLGVVVIKLVGLDVEGIAFAVDAVSAQAALRRARDR